MAAESIITKIRPGFPIKEASPDGLRTIIEYVDTQSSLESAAPNVNDTWGDYDGEVDSANIEPLPGTTYAILTVTMTDSTQSGGTDGTTPGTPKEVTLEVEWVMFQRSLYEHPVFAIGESGPYALTSEDIASIQLWESNEDAVKKGEYKYKADPNSDTYSELSTNAKTFAKGIQLGLDSWEDYRPVITKTTTIADGPPSSSSAGQKNNPPSFSGGPTGYEWRKSADRGLQSGKKTDWSRVEQWEGAKKILIDKNEIFWTTPT